MFSMVAAVWSKKIRFTHVTLSAQRPLACWAPVSAVHASGCNALEAVSQVVASGLAPAPQSPSSDLIASLVRDRYSVIKKMLLHISDFAKELLSCYALAGRHNNV